MRATPAALQFFGRHLPIGLLCKSGAALRRNSAMALLLAAALSLPLAEKAFAQYSPYPQALPAVSTGSVDFNTVDCPFTRSAGGNGAFGGSSRPGSGNGGRGGAMPALPPGWIGVQNTHTGEYMGAIPPGGNLVDFFRGAYGIEPGQEAEAAWILENQLPQAYESGMFDGMGVWGPGGP
ncbi:MAG: hypothetical protein IPK73_26215 [Candidatus Obscuribacter sp.]|nr:hypothetical protein [Candidatus Obscuribacter sp.]MBK9277621.1 hypothetical protein [Candidatus Obscuribacter sp.]